VTYTAIILHEGYAMREIHRMETRELRHSIDLLSLRERPMASRPITNPGLPVPPLADTFRLMHVEGQYAFYWGPL
jgi:hypothetical protein